MTSLWRVLEDAAGSGEEETPEDKGPVMAGRPCWVGFFPRSSQATVCTCLSLTSVSAVRGGGHHFAPSPLLGGKSDVGREGSFM